MMPAGPKAEYATRSEVQLIRQDLADFKVEITKQIGDFKLDMTKQLAALEASLHKTIITTLIAVTAIFGTLVTVLKLFKG